MSDGHIEPEEAARLYSSMMSTASTDSTTRALVMALVHNPDGRIPWVDKFTKCASPHTISQVVELLELAAKTQAGSALRMSIKSAVQMLESIKENARAAMTAEDDRMCGYIQGMLEVEDEDDE